MPSIAFLGLGRMGAAIAGLLHRKNYELTVWNRSAEKAQAFRKPGITVASTAAEAARGRDIVFTMLADDHATEAVVFGEDGKTDAGILATMAPGGLHVSLSTISVRLGRRLESAHAQYRQRYVAAPVFGRPVAAEEGKLWVVAAGAQDAVASARPMLEAMGRGLTVLSEQPWQALALKVGGNLMITVMNQTLSELAVYARAQGIDPALFQRTVNDALFQSKIYENYGRIILHPPEHPGFTVTLGAKDVRLVREAAADAGTRMRLADYIADVFHRAEEAGLGDQEWAVAQYTIAERDGTLKG